MAVAVARHREDHRHPMRSPLLLALALLLCCLCCPCEPQVVLSLPRDADGMIDYKEFMGAFEVRDKVHDA